MEANPTSSFKKVAEGIKSLRIQGAHAITLSAINVLEEQIRQGAQSAEIISGSRLLINARPVEPALRNCIKITLDTFKRNGREAAASKAHELALELDEGQESIARNGAELIRSGDVIMTHCHSSTVVRILALAHAQGKKITVISTETRPKYQGRKTASELANLGIRTIMIVDSAANYYASEADKIMVGCDAIAKEGGIVNKIGTSTLAMIAREHKIPFYSAASLLKFDPETKYPESIEERSREELLCDTTNISGFKNVIVRNPAFDLTPPELVTGIITEKGVLKPKKAVMLAAKLLSGK